MCKNAYALIFAGGVGSRMKGSSRPKQFIEFGGRPLIAYTIDAFLSCPDVSEIVLVCVEEWIDYLSGQLGAITFDIPVNIIPGGSTGQESRMAGLEYLYRHHHDESHAVVLMHDGVRPFIDSETITKCILSARKYGPTATISLCTETIVTLNKDNTIDSIPNRNTCALARAPQAFLLGDLYRCYVKAINEKIEFVDSISLVKHFGSKVYFVEGPSENIKITTPFDLDVFEAHLGR